MAALVRQAVDKLPLPWVETGVHLQQCQSETVEVSALNVLGSWQELEESATVRAFELGVMPALLRH
jgi:hypothetical protein